ncbi:MAG: hypothetical protein IPK26_23615 [Planctomycetes bacterium]|nr:hypothetical protein [Planctomycetota bacterium]
MLHSLRLSPLVLFGSLLTAQGDCLDQSYVPNPPNNGLEVTASQPVTQTFTVGRSGFLTRVEIAQINHHRGTPQAPLQVDLVACDSAGVPTATVLASVSFQPGAVPVTRGPLLVDLLLFNIPVVAGQQLGIALSTAAMSGGSTYACSGNAPGGAYAAGQVFIQQNLGLSVWDLSFQTWVSAPASWTNYGVGHPGTQGVPALVAAGNPVLGSNVPVTVGNPAGVATLGAVFFGVQRANLPTPFGGTALLVVSANVSLAVPVGGAQLALTIPSSTVFCGVVVQLQAVVVDTGASHGLAFSRGLELVLGG